MLRRGLGYFGATFAKHNAAVMLDRVYGTIPDASGEHGSAALEALRDVSQLGALAVLEPRARHTRWEHSLGVAHLAGLVAARLGLGAHDAECARLAGLYHDAGHRPFSHLYDRLSGTRHEERSAEAVRALGLAPHEEADVVAHIEGTHPLPLIAGRGADADCDRLDYLLRDSAALGLPQPFTLEECLGAFSLGPSGGLVVDGRLSRRAMRARAQMHADFYKSAPVLAMEAHLEPFLRRRIAAGRPFTETDVLVDAGLEWTP